MGRTTIYATLRQYQPYIDVIRKELNIPDNVPVDVKFNDMNKKQVIDRASGYASMKDGVYIIRVSKHFGHVSTLQFLMHEFKHIQQQITRRLAYVGGFKWLGKPAVIHHPSEDFGLYRQSPWEVEAYDYQDTIYAVFPSGRLPEPRKYIGSANNGSVKFYKVKR